MTRIKQVSKFTDVIFSNGFIQVGSKYESFTSRKNQSPKKYIRQPKILRIASIEVLS